MNYPHSHFWINGRNVFIKDILEDKILGKTEFETNTFTFLKEWLLGKEEFGIQTSGSTGAPKQITLSRDQMIASAQLSQRALQLNSTYNALVCLDTKYIAGKMMLVRSMVSKMQVFAVDPCANPLVKIPVDITLHFAALVPYQIKTILESKHPHLLDNLLTIIIGGAPLDTEAHQKLDAFSCVCYATYGMTETVSHIAIQRLNGHLKQKHFQTLPGVTTHTDERGCLVIETPFSQKVVTNDLVEIVNHNCFKWLGRWDNIINTGGVKVIPEIVEAEVNKILKQLEMNNIFFISKVFDEKLGERIVLVIEKFLHERLAVEELCHALVQSITSYQRPKEIHVVHGFTFTESGKINRHETLKNVSLVFQVKN